MLYGQLVISAGLVGQAWTQAGVSQGKRPFTFTMSGSVDASGHESGMFASNSPDEDECPGVAANIDSQNPG